MLSADAPARGSPAPQQAGAARSQAMPGSSAGRGGRAGGAGEGGGVAGGGFPERPGKSENFKRKHKLAFGIWFAFFFFFNPV